MDIGTSSLYTDYITSTASNNKASSLTDKAKTDYSNASDEELMDVCKEFESYFLEKIFHTMIDSTKLFSGKEESSYASQMVDYVNDTAVQTIASQATEQGTLGIAQTLYEQMKLQYSGISPQALENASTTQKNDEEA